MPARGDGSAVHEPQVTDTELTRRRAAAPRREPPRRATPCGGGSSSASLFAVLGTIVLVKVIGGSSRAADDDGPVAHLPGGARRGDADPRGGLRRRSASRSAAVPVVAARAAPRAARSRSAPPRAARAARSWSSSAPSTTRSAPRSAGRSSPRCRGSGRFAKLYDVESSSTRLRTEHADVQLLRHRRTAARYLVFRPYEVASDVLGRTGYRPLMRVPRAIRPSMQRRLDPIADVPVRRRRATWSWRARRGSAPSRSSGCQPRPDRGRARRTPRTR